MNVFCVLWVPLFYLLRRTFNGTDVSGGVWALLLGSITATIQFFLGFSVNPGGFGFSRWLFGFVDIVSLPVLIPFLIYFLMLLFRGFSGDADFSNFVLLWLIPAGVFRALNWNFNNDPILLIATPLLWTSLTLGINFFINWAVSNFNWYIAAICILCIILLPIAAASSYWAFFSQRTLLGFLLFFITHIPFGFSFVFEILRS